MNGGKREGKKKRREKSRKENRKKEERDSFSSALYDIFPSTRMRSLITHDYHS
jgi:hypothetical protein